MPKTATARLTVPTQVDWICFGCGAVNRKTQNVTFIGTAQGALLTRLRRRKRLRPTDVLPASGAALFAPKTGKCKKPEIGACFFIRTVL